MKAFRYAVIVASFTAFGGCSHATPAATDSRITFGGSQPAIVAPVRANDAPPHIVAVWFSEPRYHWGDLARIDVVASTNVASLEMRVASYSRGLRRHAYGEFRGVYHVPLLPPFLRPAYRLPFRFVARNAAGAAERLDASILIH